MSRFFDQISAPPLSTSRIRAKSTSCRARPASANMIAFSNGPAWGELPFFTPSFWYSTTYTTASPDVWRENGVPQGRSESIKYTFVHLEGNEFSVGEFCIRLGAVLRRGTFNDRPELSRPSCSIAS